MRITRVLVKNFRGIRHIELDYLQDIVVIAGQNGSGKSCILDAIRLVKSTYGGYQQNEYHQWFGEFQINFSGDPRAFGRLFNNPKQPLIVEIDVHIHELERAFLKKNADSLILDQAWRTVVPELHGWRSMDTAPFAAQYRTKQTEVRRQAKQDRKIFDREINLPKITARILINPGEAPIFEPSKALELIFSTYDPLHLGVIDYHGPHRLYAREPVNNININIEASEEQRRQSALYNYSAKYGNVKSEMASAYVKEALAARAGTDIKDRVDLTDALKDLFLTFFPDKEFLGVQPERDGSLSFLVRIGGKESHDLDELSSGEKEILYGYLRLRSSAPSNSVILLDEPELHLNPRLTRRLAGFYQRHLADALGNQVWLVTHSDAILRDSVGRNGISVFHITPGFYTESNVNQARPVQADMDLEAAIIDMVGDLASYNPGGRVIIFEGEEAEFDIWMVSELFPELAAKANLISGTNKTRVRSLHSLLEKIIKAGKVPPYHIFSIVDKDEDEIDSMEANRLSWIVYHIENFLLNPEYIVSAMASLLGVKWRLQADEVNRELRICAEETVPSLVSHSVLRDVNALMSKAAEIRIDPQSRTLGGDLSNAIERSRQRVEKLASGDLSEQVLDTLVQKSTAQRYQQLADQIWTTTFRGRDILKRFIGKHGDGAKYEHVRNAIVAAMRDDEHRPAAMEETIRRLLSPLIIERSSMTLASEKPG